MDRLPIRGYAGTISVAQRAADVVILALALHLSTGVLGQGWSQQYITLLLASTLLFVLLADVNGLYASFRAVRPAVEASRALKVWAWVVALLVFSAFATRTSDQYARSVALVWIAVVPATLVAWRLGVRTLLRFVRRRGHDSRTLAIYGTGAPAVAFARAVASDRGAGLSVVGFYDDDAEVGSLVAGTPWRVLGGAQRMARDAADGRLDQIHLSLPPGEEDRATQFLEWLGEIHAPVFLIPHPVTRRLAAQPWREIAGQTVVNLYSPPISGADAVAKRTIDVVLSCIILILTSPLLLLIALAVRLTSSGPVLYKQRRYGIGNREITVWKFRTMYQCESPEQFRQAVRHDPRVTPVGRFLRRTSLDEMPQFLNVIAGTMSIVGPRPHTAQLNETYREAIPGYMKRLVVRPGITGLAQVLGWRGETRTLEDMSKRVEADLTYIRNWSVWTDLKIIVLTVFVGMVHRNSY